MQLIDPRGSGQGATRASAGILAPTSKDIHRAPASRALQPRSVRRLHRDGSPPTRTDRLNIDGLGTLQVARTDDEARELEQAARALAQRGRRTPSSMTTAPGVSNRHLTDTIRAGLLVPSTDTSAWRRSGSALEDAASAPRRDVFDRAVERIETTAEPARPRPRAAVEAETVVIAAGSWSGGIPMFASPASRSPDSWADASASPSAKSPVAPSCGARVAYLVPWTDGSMLVGATVEDAGFDERVTVAGVRQLLEAACTFCLRCGRQPSSTPGRVCGRRPPTSCRSSAVHRQCAACITPPATTEMACCSRR